MLLQNIGGSIMKKMKNWLKPVAAVIILFLAGLTGALVALNITNMSQTTVSSSSNVTTSSVSYKNSTSTTEAVKKVQ